MLAVANSGNGRIEFLEMASLKFSDAPLPEAGLVQCLAFSPDGKTLASGSSGENAVRLWDVSSRKPTAALKGHKDSVTSVAFSPDGKLLASGSRDGTVGLWKIPSGKKGEK
jgi:WD40 repeat protein